LRKGRGGGMGKGKRSKGVKGEGGVEHSGGGLGGVGVESRTGSRGAFQRRELEGVRMV